MRLKVMTPERLVQIMKDQSAREYQHVNETVFDHVSQQAPHARRNQGAGRGNGNGRVIAQHVEPNAMRFSQLTTAKASAFHLFQQTGDGTIAIHLHRSGRNCQILARSEERRVGKECRSRWSRDYKITKRKYLP